MARAFFNETVARYSVWCIDWKNDRVSIYIYVYVYIGEEKRVWSEVIALSRRRLSAQASSSLTFTHHRAKREKGSTESRYIN